MMSYDHFTEPMRILPRPFKVGDPIMSAIFTSLVGTVSVVWNDGRNYRILLGKDVEHFCREVGCSASEAVAPIEWEIYEAKLDVEQLESWRDQARSQENYYHNLRVSQGKRLRKAQATLTKLKKGLPKCH